jgi:hypothetical protein
MTLAEGKLWTCLWQIYAGLHRHSQALGSQSGETQGSRDVNMGAN